MKLKEIVQKSETPAGKTFDVLVLALIIYSLFSLSVETIPDLPKDFYKFLKISEVVVMVLFTIEYILRIITSEKKLAYIFSFHGIIDFVAIAPFYLSLGIDLRGIRAFRLFKVFRILKLTRYTKAIERFGKALVLAREEVIIFALATGILLYLSAVGIYYFEHQAQPEIFKSIPHSLWWAVATLTTVGYGDVYPVTAGGKIFTFFILMIGLGIVAVPAGLLASALSKIRRDMEKGS
ncbi:ion transporter [Rhabdochromatium marinum]|uniref:ion transporter n=1 Tax=Rhabdochromatium marinum TaxID=48729 RepID=UPI001903BDB8|nr:ion transporter [Rhabdochromatium marinum]MBK1649379.1 voltage-gated potassium channel [Rhabdochromatium marinum]